MIVSIIVSKHNFRIIRFISLRNITNFLRQYIHILYAEEHEQLSLFVILSNHEQKKKRKYDIGRRENMPYYAENDEYICAQGKKLKAVGTTTRKSDTGYKQEVTIYECSDCKDCPVKEKCIRQRKMDKPPLSERVKRLNVSKYFVAQREAMLKRYPAKKEYCFELTDRSS